MSILINKFIAASGLACAVAGLGVSVGAGVASADCVAGYPKAVLHAESPAVLDCDGIAHARLSGNTLGHVDGHGWAPGQGIEDLEATQDYRRRPVMGVERGPCLKWVTCHTA